MGKWQDGDLIPCTPPPTPCSFLFITCRESPTMDPVHQHGLALISIGTPWALTTHSPKVLFIFSHRLPLFIWLISPMRKKSFTYILFYLQQSQIYICGLLVLLTHSARDVEAKTLLSMTPKNGIPAGQQEAWLIWKTCVGPYMQWKPKQNQARSLNKWKRSPLPHH